VSEHQQPPPTAENWQQLANYRRWVKRKKLFAADEVAPLLAYIDHLHGLLGRARFWMHAAGPTHRIFVSYRDDCKAIDALLREHGIGREGDGTG